MKHLFCIGILTCIAFPTLSQNNILKKVDGVIISEKKITCNNPTKGEYSIQRVLVIENTNAVSKNITWQVARHYGNKCYGCSESEENKPFELSVQANQTIIGSCDISSYSGLKFLDHYTKISNSPQLSQLEIINLSTSTSL